MRRRGANWRLSTRIPEILPGGFLWARGEYPELAARGIKNTGTPNAGAPIVTAGGLVFIGATTDFRFRAFEAKTGKLLWSTELESSAIAPPITYQGANGKQYVVIGAGGAGHLRPFVKSNASRWEIWLWRLVCRNPRANRIPADRAVGSDGEVRHLANQDKFHGEWNYTIRPRDNNEL